MKTLVLRIPDDLARDLEAEAERTHLTKYEVARRRLIAAGLQAQTSGMALIADLVGTVEGGPVQRLRRVRSGRMPPPYFL